MKYNNFSKHAKACSGKQELITTKNNEIFVNLLQWRNKIEIRELERGQGRERGNLQCSWHEQQ